MEEKASRRPRLLLIVTGVLALVMAANCIAIAVHISSLRATAASSSGDAVPELLAQADDFRPAETIFLVFAVLLAFTFVVLAMRVLLRRGRTAARE